VTRPSLPHVRFEHSAGYWSAEATVALDGYEAARRIKADPALKQTPIIAVTSYALAGDEEKARAAGCDAYVAEPYSPRELLAKVRELLA
jgi:two-component system cell cycle response regulator DivK